MENKLINTQFPISGQFPPNKKRDKVFRFSFTMIDSLTRFVRFRHSSIDQNKERFPAT